MLNFSNVNFKYKDESKLIIENLSFNATKGDFISIVGPSGCGKSTIFRLISKLETPLSGDIFIKGNNINTLNGYIGYMPQKDSLLPWKTILQNAALPLEINKKDPKKAEEYLKLFGLDNYKNKYPRDLSGGMRQRVSFIRTLLTGSEVLILDEPFSALDAITKISMQEWLLTQWSNFNKTILFITHDVEEALFLSNKIFVISEKPITKLKEIRVPLPYPRNRHMLSKPEMLKIKEDLINELKQRIEL
ncbi:ABC transporter ATP-binding protein [Clostridium amazonitimonense]|uniref:ABC transporter ATP-binding protein n=1 Tax=Clostridium amazonitimonense TaxID=1499689 RepID=UPI00050955C2|nr:ABC transporter ATP-binding protein [Clostridium amazonitimonense]